MFARPPYGPGPSRRGLLRLTAGGAAALLVGCGSEGSNLLSGWQLPELDDLEMGELQLGWDAEGNLYRIRPAQHSVTRMVDDQTESWTVGSADDVASGGLNYPVALGGIVGRVVILEGGGGRIRFYDLDGTPGDVVGSPGTDEGQLLAAADAVVDGEGRIQVVDLRRHKVLTFDPGGGFVREFGARGTHFGELNGPRSVVVDGDGHLHVLEAGNRRVQVFDDRGTFVRSYGGPGSGAGELVGPAYISIDPLGNTWVSDPVAGAVHVFGPRGAYLRTFDALVWNGIEIQPLRAAVSPTGGVFIQANLVDLEA